MSVPLTEIPPENDYYLTRKDLAKRWSIHITTIEKWDSKNQNPIAVYRFGTGPKAPIRYRFSDVLRLEQNSLLLQPGA